MKFTKRLSIFIAAFGVAMVLLQGCKPAKPGFWKNGQIDAGKKQDFHLLNDKLIKALKAGNTHDVEDMMSAEQITIDDKHLLQQIVNHLNTEDYSLFEEFYVVNKPNVSDTIKTDAGIKTYHLEYTQPTGEVYIGLFLPKSGDNKYMITVVFGKYSYGWRIAELQLHKYNIDGKTALDLYQLSQQEYAKGYLVDAINNMTLAGQCMRPSDLWAYNNVDTMAKFTDKLVTEGNAQFKFPVKLAQVAGQPLVFRISNEEKDGHNYPSIYYLTKINLKDTTALKRENIAVKKAVGNLFPGIDKDKKYVLYCAFNEMPSAKKFVKWFDMADRLQN